MSAIWLEEVVRRALHEDLGPGDITTEACVPADRTAVAELVAREAGVLAGLQAAWEVFRQLGGCELAALKADGEALSEGDVVARVEGLARRLLMGERTALNFLRHLSGIATLTARYVAAVRGTRAAVVDTRKTTPGLRALEKAAVRAGGGRNHRMGLYDAVLIKDNHIVAAGGIAQAVQAARRKAPFTATIEVEVSEPSQVEEALAAGADVIMLDNMDVETLRACVERIAGKCIVEASGGITLEDVAQVAATGVDVISVGALTHSAPALDIAMRLLPCGAA
ncbi:MAG: carboxylating nicotinate-nucleotide diphosphorylase [Armatimonadota bacterium]